MLNGNTLTPGRTFKCPACGKPCVVDANSLDDFVYYKGKYYHDECFNSRVYQGKKPVTLEQIQRYKQASKDRLTELYNIDVLYCFLLRYYDLTVIPTTFWMKVKSLTEGNYHLVSVAIPYEHLYDMWRRKANYLNKVAENNRRKGKPMEPEQRLQYDLAILINQYDSYLRFLEQEKIKEAEVEEEPKKVIPVVTVQQNHIKSIDDDNIDDLVDEVFGE